jgi:hypothetical protein
MHNKKTMQKITPGFDACWKGHVNCVRLLQWKPLPDELKKQANVRDAFGR